MAGNITPKGTPGEQDAEALHTFLVRRAKEGHEDDRIANYTANDITPEQYFDGWKDPENATWAVADHWGIDKDYQFLIGKLESWLAQDLETTKTLIGYIMELLLKFKL